MALLAQPLVQSANLGIGGQTTASMTANAPANVDPRFTNRNRRVVVLWGGANDLRVGENATTIYNRIKTYCQARKNAGETVIFMSLIPFASDPTIESVRISTNTILRADFATATAVTRVFTGASWADYMIDLGNDPNIGVAGSQLNTTYFQVDQVHLTNAGYAVVAGYAKDALNFIFP